MLSRHFSAIQPVRPLPPLLLIFMKLVVVMLMDCFDCTFEGMRCSIKGLTMPGVVCTVPMFEQDLIAVPGSEDVPLMTGTLAL